MKLAKSDKLWHLFLENSADAERWAEHYKSIMPHITWNAWKGFASQSFRKTFANWLAHETNSHVELKLLAQRTRILLSDGDRENMSMLTYCEYADRIILDKIEAFKRGVQKHGVVRTTGKLGYNLDSFEKSCLTINYDIVFGAVSDEQLTNFILLGTPESDLLEIPTQDTLVFENDSSLSIDMTEYLADSEYKTIFDFKMKTLKLEPSKLLEFICTMSLSGKLKRIVFETTGQDFAQISKWFDMIKILELNEIPLTIECMTYNEKLIRFFADLSSVKIIDPSTKKVISR